jgi:hypothetical protein
MKIRGGHARFRGEDASRKSIARSLERLDRAGQVVSDPTDPTCRDERRLGTVSATLKIVTPRLASPERDARLGP